jgi:PAS domain-containing protein
VIILILGAVFTAKVVRARRKLRDANAQLQDDLVARDLVEAALRDSEARFRALFDSAPQTVVAVDRSGTIIFANQRSREMFGSDSLIGKNIEILVPQSSRPLLALTRNMDAGGNGPLHWNHPR